MTLKSCPFCGSNHLSIELKPSGWNIKHVEDHVVCSDCACMSPLYIWNMRRGCLTSLDILHSADKQQKSTLNEVI